MLFVNLFYWTGALGIDEIALVKGQKNYCVVLVDIDKKIIVGMVKNRTQVEVKKYLEAWGEEVLEQIEEVIPFL